MEFLQDMRFPQVKRASSLMNKANFTGSIDYISIDDKQLFRQLDISNSIFLDFLMMIHHKFQRFYFSLDEVIYH